MKEITAALVKAQAEIQPASKDRENSFFKNAKYADLTAVWNACRAALTKNGLSVTQKTDFDGNDLWLETVLMHVSGESISSRYPLRPQQPTPQGYGSAMTYARRYCLAALVGVVADDDDDGNEASTKTNGHAIEVERRPSQSAKKIEADGVSAAREWYHGALSDVEKAKTKADLNAWIAKNEKATDKLRLVLVDEWERLCEKVDARMKEFR